MTFRRVPGKFLVADREGAVWLNRREAESRPGLFAELWEIGPRAFYPLSASAQTIASRRYVARLDAGRDLSGPSEGLS